MSDSTKNIPSIKIAMLGGSGAGKTIYLATLFESLRELQSQHKFFIDTENKTANKLHNIYLQLSSGNVTGTRTSDKYQFTLCVNNENKYRICTFEYMDYRGDDISAWQENINDKENEKIEEFVNNSNFVFGLLDGVKLLKYMREPKSPESRKWVQEDLFSIINTMDNRDIKVPVHFVITKWDSIKDLNEFTWKDIKEKLMDISEIKGFVNKRPNITIRVIPVSSVGFGFFKPEVQDGITNMVRTEKYNLEPYQVEVPLAYVFFDLVRDAKQKLDNQGGLIGLWYKILGLFKENQIGNFLPNNVKPLGVIAPLFLDIMTSDAKDKYLKNARISKEYSLLIDSLTRIKEDFEDTNSTILRPSSRQ
ncbi:MAG: hypothetical protein HEQ19_00090 [Gloeotrichia echinulata CP02]